MTGGNIVNDFEDVYISSKPPAVIGYEAVPCIFSWYNNDSPIRTGVIKGPARAYGVVCNGVYYKIPDSAIGTKTISKEGTSIKISILFSKDPKYQVPDGFVIVDENFDHYISDDVAKYPLIFSPSPQINGTAEGFVIFLRSSYPDGKDWDYRVFITTIQPPPVSGYYIKSLKIASGWGSSLPKFPGNPFEGFEDVRVYPFSGIPINIQRDQYGVPQIRDENPFFCVITPGPFVGEESAAIACYDLDFSYARKYQFNHAAQLANNVPAAIEREKIWKEWEGTKVFFVRRGRTIRYMDSGVTYTALGGPGKIPAIYSSIPTVSAPTYSGFVITSVTIVCQGYYYDSDAQILDQDPTGSGAIITIDEVKRGKIKKITLKEGGAGYSATPSIGFTEPGYNPSDVPSIEGIKQTLVISAASAGAVLGSQDSVDASLEIYEIEGSAENVLAQVPVKLAKRVSYS
ncbi:hypothetical protein EBZ39_10875 [bacterium]|nr:hypothetical protein [bacterium]